MQKRTALLNLRKVAAFTNYHREYTVSTMKNHERTVLVDMDGVMADLIPRPLPTFQPTNG